MAIVTCGGLCPGLNDVVQGLVRKLEDYGVPEGNILGIKYESACLQAAQCHYRMMSTSSVLKTATRMLTRGRGHISLLDQCDRAAPASSAVFDAFQWRMHSR